MTSLIQPKSWSKEIARCSERMRLFCLEMMASDLSNAKACAIRAGYSKKTAAVMAVKLLKNEKVQAVLRKFQQEREKRTQITADDVWRYLHRTMYFDPINVFESAKNGFWFVKRLEDIPEEYRQLIEEVQIDESKGGNQLIKVKFVSKGLALGIAAKHAIEPIPQKHLVGVAAISWDELCRPPEGDPTEDKVLEIEAQATLVEKE